MHHQSLFAALALAALMHSTATRDIGLRKISQSKGPMKSVRRSWRSRAALVRSGQVGEDTAQDAPLTPEYKALLEASVADQASGGLGDTGDHARCSAAGMPWMMVAFRPLEFVISPETTYILIADFDPLRRIFTDGRAWPEAIEPTFQGYSIGRWIDEDGDGRYDVLEVETRGFKGPVSTTS